MYECVLVTSFSYKVKSLTLVKVAAARVSVATQPFRHDTPWSGLFTIIALFSSNPLQQPLGVFHGQFATSSNYLELKGAVVVVVVMHLHFLPLQCPCANSCSSWEYRCNLLSLFSLLVELLRVIGVCCLHVKLSW